MIILLYTKMILLNREKLDELSFYEIPEIKEIIRFNISNFMFKMDNAYFLISIPNGERLRNCESGKNGFLRYSFAIKYE